MHTIPGQQAWKNVLEHPRSRWPSAQSVSSDALPAAKPKLQIDAGARFFCIGSCFARNVEEFLLLRGHPVDSLMISFPPAEWQGRPNGLLNKFTTPSMLNELEWSLADKPFPVNSLLETQAGYIDCQLSPGHRPVSRQRVLERRAQLQRHFAQVSAADVVVLTLGLVEVWYDQELTLSLNMAPPFWWTRRSDRFVMQVTGYHENAHALRRTIELLHASAPRAAIIVTVSPVPMQETFTGIDVRVANGYSKAVLRAVAADVTNDFAFADYFPAYDAVQQLDGSSAFEADRIRVRDATVQRVVEHFLRSYASGNGQPRYPIDDALYFRANPEAAALVHAGQYASALAHWEHLGRNRQVKLVPPEWSVADSVRRTGS